MKENFKKRRAVEIFLLLLILGGAAFVRFYHFPERINFGPEQADSLITAAKDILDKPSLLGQSYFARTTSTGHQLFASPLFSYSLVPLLLVFKYNPLLITVYFVLLNLATGVILFLVTDKMMGRKAAFFSTFLFLFNTTMIYHSLFIWILNYLPLIGILTFLFFRRFYQKRGSLDPLWIGVLMGIGVGLEYLFLPTAVLASILILILSKKRIRDFSLFILGLLISNAPTIVFDLKHNYYHLATLYRYFLDVTAGLNKSQISYYHFLHFWPLLAILAGLALRGLAKLSVVLGIIVAGLYLWMNLGSSSVSFNRAVRMSDSFNYLKLAEAADIIAKEKPEKFNVVSLVPSDTFRAYPLRYLLTYRLGKVPQGVENYQNINLLYAIAPKDYDFGKSGVWEIQIFGQTELAQLLKSWPGRYGLFRLSKN